ncbi:MAG TPA: hypothetical protein VFN10_11770 [Thermoanaerobaculia bacterium]|nr:hypothetical protein [Thermoanaerobaculia bacterium]
MSSKKSTDPWSVDFDRDMPLTPADIEALERARELQPLTAVEYQQWCDLVARHHPPPPRQTNSDDDEPFTL